MKATDFHSEVVEIFDDKYNTSPDFVERKAIWTNLLEKYIKPRMKVLDAGCGSGVFSFYLAEKKDCQIEAFDGSDKMIEHCRKVQAQRKVSDINFQHKYLPLEDKTYAEKFELIISSSVLEYVDDLEACLQSLANNLKQDGRLILSLPNGQAFYRKFERLLFNTTGKPNYLSYVKNVPSLADFNRALDQLGFEMIEYDFFAGNNAVSKTLRALLPQKYACNLFIAVYKRK